MQDPLPSLSQELEALADLHALQAEIEDPKLDSENPYYNSSYTSLREVLRIARAACNKHNFILVQRALCGEGGRMELHTELLHKKGWGLLSTYALLPVKNDPQGMGAAITYARRFAVKAMLAMADADDDGNEASGLAQKPEPGKIPAKPAGPSPETAKAKRIADLGEWIVAHEEYTNVFLRGPTFGKNGDKVPWIAVGDTWKSLTKEQLGMITKSDSTLAKFKAAVLTFNDLAPVC